MSAKRRFRNISGETLWTETGTKLVKVPDQGVIDVTNDYEYSASLWKQEGKGDSPAVTQKNEGSK